MRSPRRLLADESGNATIVTAGLVVALASLLLVLVHAYTQVRDQQSARTAADMAAVAGAWAQAWAEPACPAARQLADLNGGELLDCDVDTTSGDVVVTVEINDQEARARAGPM